MDSNPSGLLDSVNIGIRPAVIIGGIRFPPGSTQNNQTIHGIKETVVRS